MKEMAKDNVKTKISLLLWLKSEKGLASYPGLNDGSFPSQ